MDNPETITLSMLLFLWIGSLVETWKHNRRFKHETQSDDRADRH